jgi:hypothetical protein
MLAIKPWLCRNPCTELWHCTNRRNENATRRHDFNKPFNGFNQQVLAKQRFHYRNQKQRKVRYGTITATRRIPVALSDGNSAYAPAFKNHATVKCVASFRDRAAGDSWLINDCGDCHVITLSLISVTPCLPSNRFLRAR